MRTTIRIAASFLGIIFSLGLALPAFAADMNGTTWHPLRVGAGGWLVGMDIAPDGTKVVRADTYGAYLWTGTAWKQLVTTQSMPASDIGYDFGDGVYEIRIAPSNTNRLYMSYQGYIYRSDDRGAHWTKTAFARVTMSPNDGFRTWGEKMAVDPINPNVVYVGTEANGVFVTTDAGSSWSPVTAIPAAVSGTGGITGIVFMPQTGETGRTNTVLISSTGNGVYISTNAGASWSRTSGGPTKVENATLSPDGIYYAATGDGAWYFKNGAWTLIKNENNQGIHSIAVDPANPNRIIIGSGGGGLDISNDHGVTWTGWIWGSTQFPTTRVAGDIPWLSWTEEKSMSNGNMIFDPTASNKLYMSEGIGVWYTFPALNPVWSVGPTWYSQSYGIEQLVANQIISPPGGKPVIATWDRPVYYIANPEVFPSKHGPTNDYAINMGWAIDYAATNPSFVVGIFNWWGREQSGYSTDGGQTWTQFADKPADVKVGKIAGSIAASTPLNMVWVSSNNGNLSYTKDGGKTWTTPTISGVPTTGETGWGWAYYMKRFIVAADRVTPGTFYAYNYLNGLYRSTDGGATWTLIKSGQITPWAYYNSKMKTVPGQAGHLFFTSGQSGGQGIGNPADQEFIRSTDGGVTWTAIPNVKEVYDVGFGAPKTAGGYPAIYIIGWVNNLGGVWRSDDNALTWTRLTDYPLDSLDSMTSISGDMNIYGNVYVGFSGSGFAYGTTGAVATSPPPVADTTAPSVPTNVAATASVSQIALTWTASTDNVGVTGYKVYRNDVPLATITTNSYTDLNVAPSTTYTYKVSASDASGNSSAQSTAISATTLIPTTASPDGTRVPPAGSIIDNNLDVWTFQGYVPMKNGQPIGGDGSILTWCGGKISILGGNGLWYTYGATTGWTQIPGDPCGTTTTPPPPPPISPATPPVSPPPPVTPPPPPPTTTPPPPTPTPSTFSIGSKVKTTANLNVRNKANTKSGKILCIQPAGSLGTIKSGPATNQGYTWWNINFDTGCDGWSVQSYLTTSIAYAPESQSASAATSVEELTSLIEKLKAALAQLQGR